MPHSADDVLPIVEERLAALWGEPVSLHPGPNRRGNAGVYHAGPLGGRRARAVPRAT